jgi:hypothetical protein
MMAPASRRRCTVTASTFAGLFWRARIPSVASVPVTSMFSLIVTGIPWSGPRTAPRARVIGRPRLGERFFAQLDDEGIQALRAIAALVEGTHDLDRGDFAALEHLGELDGGAVPNFHGPRCTMIA